MSDPKLSDPADKAADGAFGGVRRSGYGDESARLARIRAALDAIPDRTLPSGDGRVLLAALDAALAENARLCDVLAAYKVTP